MRPNCPGHSLGMYMTTHTLLSPLLRNHIVSSTIEHPAVEATIQALPKASTRITWVAPNTQGVVDPEAVAKGNSKFTSGFPLVLRSKQANTYQLIYLLISACL
jgi:selenocysteine lyase/cysteine desulfurase